MQRTECSLLLGCYNSYLLCYDKNICAKLIICAANVRQLQQSPFSFPVLNWINDQLVDFCLTKE